jgi:hypothetical protein
MSREYAAASYDSFHAAAFAAIFVLVCRVCLMFRVRKKESTVEGTEFKTPKQLKRLMSAKRALAHMKQMKAEGQTTNKHHTDKATHADATMQDGFANSTAS